MYTALRHTDNKPAYTANKIYKVLEVEEFQGAKYYVIENDMGSVYRYCDQEYDFNERWSILKEW